jgi:hypothetical protein
MDDITRRRALTGLAGGGAALAASGCAGMGVTAGEDGPFSEAALGETLRFLDEGDALRSGLGGDRRLAAFVANRLAQFGYTVERQSVIAQGFAARRMQVGWSGGVVEVEAQHIVTPTGPDGVEGPLKLWRPGAETPGASGALAVILLEKARHSRLGSPNIMGPLRRAIEGGARGVILVTDGPTGDTILLNADPSGPAASVPVAVVGPKPGAGLVAAAERGETGRLVLDGEVTARGTSNVFGRITGRGPLVVISTPRTGWTRCVAERGPGLSTFLAMAEWAPQGLAGHDLLFLTNGAHEYDNQGAHEFLAQHAPRPDATALWVHLGAGFAARQFREVAPYVMEPTAAADPQRFLVGTEDLMPVLTTAFAGLDGLAPRPAAQGAAGELGEILAKGYRPCFGMYGSHAWHHVDGDRIAMTGPELVRPVALAVRAAVRRTLGT